MHWPPIQPLSTIFHCHFSSSPGTILDSRRAPVEATPPDPSPEQPPARLERGHPIAPHHARACVDWRRCRGTFAGVSHERGAGCFCRCPVSLIHEIEWSGWERKTILKSRGVPFQGVADTSNWRGWHCITITRFLWLSLCIQISCCTAPRVRH